MTSPLPPPIGSSPFPFPLLSFSPFPQSSQPTNAAPTQNPSPLPLFPYTNPTPFAWPSSSPAFPTPHVQVSQLTFPIPDSSEFGTLRGTLDGFAEGVERCLGVVVEIRRMEEGLFDTHTRGRSEGMEVGLGGPSRLELLHLEYTQLLTSLIALSTTTHLSSLPSPLSLALTTGGTGQHDASSGNAPSGPVTVEHLTTWAEERANLEFDRREAVRASAKTVLDVLTKR